MKALLAAPLLVLLLASCATPAEPRVAPVQPAEPTNTAPSSERPTRAARIGAPFDIHPWRITVNTLRCGTAAELLAQNASNGQEPTDRVCVAAITYTNIDSRPHSYGASEGDQPQAVTDFAGYDPAGQRYEGHQWASETINPGRAGTNELIFLVAAGTELRTIQIGDVAVTA